MKSAPRSCVHSFIWVVGGGPMGMLVARELALLTQRFDLPFVVRLLEADSFGGGAGDRTASSRCSLWCHTQGAIFANTHPELSLACQRSTKRIRRLAPLAFRQPRAFAVELPGRGPWPQADDSFRALGIWHREVPEQAMRAHLPDVRLPAGSRVWRVRDGVLDLRLLSAGLLEHARAAKVEVYRERVLGLDARGERVVRLKLEREEVLIHPDDEVVFACGANLRPLLRTGGVVVPGLRVCVSNLVASPLTAIRSQVAVLREDVSVVPHEQHDGRLVNVFANGGRAEVPPEADGYPLQVDPYAVERVCRDVRETLGLEIPIDGRLAWTAAKTEICCTSESVTAAHAHLVPGLVNSWMAIPGKLSLAAMCARDLALKLIRRRLEGPYALSIWERVVRAEAAELRSPSCDDPETVFPDIVRVNA